MKTENISKIDWSKMKNVVLENEPETQKFNIQNIPKEKIVKSNVVGNLYEFSVKEGQFVTKG